MPFVSMTVETGSDAVPTSGPETGSACSWLRDEWVRMLDRHSNPNERGITPYCTYFTLTRYFQLILPVTLLRPQRRT